MSPERKSFANAPLGNHFAGLHRKAFGVKMRIHPLIRTQFALLCAHQQAKNHCSEWPYMSAEIQFHACHTQPKRFPSEKDARSLDESSGFVPPSPTACVSRGATTRVSRSDDTGRLREALQTAIGRKKEHQHGAPATASCPPPMRRTVIRRIKTKHC